MGRNQLIAEENRRKKRKLSLIKRIHASYNSTVTDYYEKIESKLHSIKLSGNYNYKQFEIKIGKFDFDVKYSKRKTKKIYTEKYDKTVEGFKLILWTVPSNPGPPQTTIKITPPDRNAKNIKEMIILIRKHKAFLRSMNDMFPSLKLSNIEFTNDIYFNDPSEAESAFEALKRNIVVKRSRAKPKIYSTSIRIGRHKIYLRGYDKNKIKNGWKPEDINRVRMEYTSTRRELKKNGLNYLYDLLLSPKFYDINNGKWNFKHFNVVRSEKLPGELDPYPIDGVFHSEYLAAKDKVSDRYRRAVEARAFRDLKFDLSDAMKLFDLKW